MIISKTPFRISFFGGGSDYPEWFLEHGGRTLAATIDKYCYVTFRELPPFFEHRIRVVYSKMEAVKTCEEIAHTVVREVLRVFEIKDGFEIHCDGDLPARSGMGSSSALAVGLINAIWAHKKLKKTEWDMASTAYYIEREKTGQMIGWQDQIQAAYGGLNIIHLEPDNVIGVEKIPHADGFDKNLMLFYTGIQRLSTDISKTYEFDPDTVYEMMGMVSRGAMYIMGGDVQAFGELLHESWTAKKKLSNKISNPVIDDLYGRARDKGAFGGKILGAGGGGFLLLVVPPKRQKAVKKALKECIYVPVKFVPDGSKIIYNGGES